MFPQSFQVAEKACRLALIRYVEERVAAGDAHAVVKRADFAPEAVELRLSEEPVNQCMPPSNR
jgi:hypothetical protein